MKDNKGFTLTELLAVIVILAILAVITTPIIWDVVESSKEASYSHQLLEIYKAAELYFTDSSIVVEDGETIYVSIGELVAADYLDPFPKDYVNGGYMNGVVEIHVASPNNQYQYLNPEETIEKDSIVNVLENQDVKNIIVSGRTISKHRNLLQELANIVVSESNNSEFMKLEGYNSFVSDSDDIGSVKKEWFKDSFLPNTQYTFEIDSRAISPTSGNEMYHAKMRFLYTDGTVSEEHLIGSHLDSTFTHYRYTSDEGKSVRAIEFTTEKESPYRFAYNLDTFSLLPEVVASPNSPVSLVSLGNEGPLTLKIVDQGNNVIEKRIALINPLYGIEGSSVEDQIVLNIDGTVEVRRNVGKMILDGYDISSNNIAIVSGSESANGYHTFEIKNVFTNRKVGSTSIMSNYFPQVSSCWNRTVNQTAISVSGNQNSVYLKVLKSEFPDTSSMIQWLKEHPVDLYYELATTDIETLASLTFENKNLRYIYVDSNISTHITVTYE